MKSQTYCVLLLVGFVGICIWSVLLPEQGNKPPDEAHPVPDKTQADSSFPAPSADTVHTRFLSKPKVSGVGAHEQLFEEADVAHTAIDFLDGKCDNTAITDALRLSGDSPASTNLDQIVGVYVSPQSTNSFVPEERMPRLFDRIALSVDGTIPEGASVKLEFRTISYDEDGKGWDDWWEVPLNKQGRMISLGKLTERWQYRLILSSKDIFSSPEIRSVRVSTAQSLRSAQEVAGIMEVYNAGKQAEAEAMKNPTLDQ